MCNKTQDHYNFGLHRLQHSITGTFIDLFQQIMEIVFVKFIFQQGQRNFILSKTFLKIK